MASGANNSRLTGMTYPDSYSLTFNYASGLDADISRLSSISDSSNTLEALTYLGLGTVVKRGHPQPSLDLTYIKLSGESNGDAGDKYIGLDRFGRVVDQRWLNSTPADLDRYQYGYDRNSNRLWKYNVVNTARSELYTYDDLNQIATYSLGTLNGGKTALTHTVNSQAWDLDAAGNWDSITTLSTTQTRTHNRQNEITAVTNPTATPTYDANGNMTTDENGNTYTYNAWNKQVSVNSTAAVYANDALNRRVSVTASSVTTDRYFSAAWQLLETYVSTSAKERYVWSPVYVDAMVLRERSTTGTLNERLYAVQDANFNVTMLSTTGAKVWQRMSYTPFGVPEFMDSTWTPGADAYAWTFLHQGGERGAADLYLFRNRSYSATLGRWMQEDPIGYEGGTNLYLAYSNNPVNQIDPIANRPFCCSNPMAPYASFCKAICNWLQTQASNDPRNPNYVRGLFNFQGRRTAGGIFCYKGIKCFCFFEYECGIKKKAVRKPGECPALDQCTTGHEYGHFPETDDCDLNNNKIYRNNFKNGIDAVKSECLLIREHVKCIDAAIIKYNKTNKDNCNDKCIAIANAMRETLQAYLNENC